MRQSECKLLQVSCKRSKTSFPWCLILVTHWKNLFVALHYQEALFSHFQYNFTSTLNQQEINVKSWNGAVNINIIQLLGTSITQQTSYNEQIFSSTHSTPMLKDSPGSFQYNHQAFLYIKQIACYLPTGVF